VGRGDILDEEANLRGEGIRKDLEHRGMTLEDPMALHVRPDLRNDIVWYGDRYRWGEWEALSA
jgi:hypothetical protein